MQGIYSRIPTTSRDSMVYSYTAVLWGQFMVQITRDEHFALLYFCTFTLALFDACAQCPIWLLSIVQITLCFPDMSLGYLLKGFQMVLVSSVISGITLFLHCTCVVL
jgi:hypothetical protein